MLSLSCNGVNGLRPWTFDPVVGVDGTGGGGGGGGGGICSGLPFLGGFLGELVMLLVGVPLGRRFLFCRFSASLLDTLLPLDSGKSMVE